MNDISFKRKVREMYLSVKLEEQYSKDEILLMYLNTINYGSGAYGIEAASQRYFSKHASELTLAEAAALIGIPQSPTYNNPIDHEDNCLARRNLVLDRMLTNGYITQEARCRPGGGSCSTRPRPRWMAGSILIQQLRATCSGSRRRLSLFRG
ncbi:MAG: transglycosylase domain-containing protein [Eggerthellaceae bacterium]